MPSRVTKKLSSTTETKTRRNGHHESRKQHVVTEEIEDDDTLESSRSEEAESALLDASQASATDPDGLAMMIDIMQSHRERHETAKAAVYKDYNKALAGLRENVKALFDKHEAQSSDIHETHVNHLRVLLQDKAEIETTMQENVSQFRREYYSHALDLQRAAEERARQLS